MYICTLCSKCWVLWLGFHQENVSGLLVYHKQTKKPQPPKKEVMGNLHFSTPFSSMVVSVFLLPMSWILCISVRGVTYLTLFSHCTGNFHASFRIGSCWQLANFLQLWTQTFQHLSPFQTVLWIIFENRIQITCLLLKVLSLLWDFLISRKAWF